MIKLVIRKQGVNSLKMSVLRAGFKLCGKFYWAWFTVGKIHSLSR